MANNNYIFKVGATIDKQSYIKMVSDLQKFGKSVSIPISVDVQALGKSLKSFTNIADASGNLTKNVQSYNVGLGKTVQITSQLNKETKELEVVSTKMSVNQEKIQKEQQRIQKAISSNLSSIQKHYNSQQQSIEKTIASRQKELEIMKQSALVRLNKGEAPNEKQLKYESDLRYKIEKQFREQIASNLTATQKYYSAQQTEISKTISLRQQELEKMKQEIKIKRDLESWKSSKLSTIDKMKIGSETIFSSPKVKSELDDLVKSINSVGTVGGKSVKQVNAEMSRFQTTVKQVGFDTKQLNKETHNYFSNLAMIGKKFLDWMVVGTLFMQTVNTIRNGIIFIAELDKSLNDIRIVTGQTQEQVEELAKSYNKLAKEMGVTTKEIAQQGAELYRQGLSSNDVDERMQAIIKYSKISGIAIDESNKIITASVNGTKADVNELIDVFSYLGDASAAGKHMCPAA